MVFSSPAVLDGAHEVIAPLTQLVEVSLWIVRQEYHVHPHPLQRVVASPVPSPPSQCAGLGVVRQRALLHLMLERTGACALAAVELQCQDSDEHCLLAGHRRPLLHPSVDEDMMKYHCLPIGQLAGVEALPRE
jgi:hypothetical protein